MKTKISHDRTLSISSIATIRHEESLQAIENTLKCLKVHKIYWFSDIDFQKDVGCEVVNIRIDPLGEKTSFNEAYSYLALKLIPEVVDTDYNLIVHYDGYAVNKNAWTDQFFNYDYIGAVWKQFPQKNRVGNGGFCLRSKRLYDAMKAIDIKYKWKDIIKNKNFERLCSFHSFNDKFSGKSVPEDVIISQIYRKQLEKEYKIVFAPEKIANRFSIESNLTSPWAMKSFGFHGMAQLNFYNSVFASIFNQN